VSRDLAKLIGAKIPVSSRELRDLGRAPRMLTNGALAICRIERDQRDKLPVALRRFLDDADALGLSGPESDALRGWLDCEEGRVEQGRAKLRAAADAMPDEDAKRSTRELVDACGTKSSVLGKLPVARAITATVVARLRDSKLLDRVSDSELAKTTRRFGEALSSSVDAGKASIPSMKDVGSLGKKARSWWPF
jgi:hypothetical protein